MFYLYLFSVVATKSTFYNEQIFLLSHSHFHLNVEYHLQIMVIISPSRIFTSVKSCSLQDPTTERTVLNACARITNNFANNFLRNTELLTWRQEVELRI